MPFRTRPQRPMILPVRFFDWQIIDRRVAVMHDSRGIELPILIAVGAEPLSRIVVKFVSKADGDSGIVKRPEFLNQAVVEFAVPFAREERHDLFTAVDEFGAVPPLAIHGVGQRHALRVARIPSVLRFAHLQNGGFARKGRYETDLWLRTHVDIPFASFHGPIRTSSCLADARKWLST